WRRCSLEVGRARLPPSLSRRLGGSLALPVVRSAGSSPLMGGGSGMLGMSTVRRVVMDFALPEIGEGIYEAEVVAWHVKPGETVKRGQALVEVMTDKASMEVPSPFAATITALRVEPGQHVKIGDVLLTCEPIEAAVAVTSGAQ